MPDVLVADGLRKVFPQRGSGVLGRRRATGRPALVDVSLTLGEGEVLGVVGESGSGKTTLARCLALLERPDAGRVAFRGRELTSLGARELRRQRRRVQIVFQDPYASLNPRLTVRSALAEVLHVHALRARADADARVHELLELVGLPRRAADRYPSDFSGGQRQRVCIARALAAEPDVLIADEAVSSLDVSVQAQVLNLLLRLRDTLGLALLFISHDVHVVRRVAPKVAVMFGGRIVEVVPPGVPLEQARHPYTQALLAAVPRLDARPLEQLEVADLAAALPRDGCPFRDRCPRAFEPCTTEDPPLRHTSTGNLVACHAVAREEAVT